MYEFISQDQADRIKDIILNTGLNNSININTVENDISLNVKDVSISDVSEHFDYDMKEIYLLNENGEDGVIENKNKFYNLFVNVGEWGYETRLINTHITLGSSKFHDYCLQIELSQAVEDENCIYIIKNISNMAGKGAICRLYRGLKNDRVEKENRKNEFISKFAHEIISLNKKRWVCIDKIDKKELFDDYKKPEIFYSLLYNMLYAMLLVESIGRKKPNNF